jgi:hypothetical protein
MGRSKEGAENISPPFGGFRGQEMDIQGAKNRRISTCLIFVN